MPKGRGGQFGAAIAFSPNGQYLFLTVGDRQRMTPAQDPNTEVGKILRLTLDGKPTILQEDRKLPEARRCVSGYGIAEAYLHAAPDGAVTIAAIIETVDNHDYHAGPNRRFMAVTRRLAPK